MDFSKTNYVNDIKVGRCSQLNKYIIGQGHSLTHCLMSLRFNIFKLLFLKNTRPIEAIFHVEPSWDGRMKVSTNGLCHMTKMAAMPINAKIMGNRVFGKNVAAKLSS